MFNPSLNYISKLSESKFETEECLPVQECVNVIEYGIGMLMKFDCVYNNDFTLLGDLIAQVKSNKNKTAEKKQLPYVLAYKSIRV